MTAPRFCSECGERLKAGRLNSLPFRSFCTNCSPRFKRARLTLIAAGAFLVIIGVCIGRYAGAREPFQFIGTPIDKRTAEAQTSPDDAATGLSRESKAHARPEQLLIPPSAADGTCGAKTKSGKPCQRKVKGGGYCWQHREQKSDGPRR